MSSEKPAHRAQVPFDESTFNYPKPAAPAQQHIDVVSPDAARPRKLSAASEYNTASTRSHSDPPPPFPASYRTKKDDIDIPSLDISNENSFLERELALRRLDKIHDWLWFAGRLVPPRPLHHQRVLSREILVTERMDLHLVWDAGRILIKPIPRFLLDFNFWREHLICKPDCACASSAREREKSPELPVAECKTRMLYKCALGFLLTYTALISHESDYHIAQQGGIRLIPDEISWRQWSGFVKQLLARKDLREIDRRFYYGELRLSRLNWIYRLSLKAFIRGYLYDYKEYNHFFQTHFARIFAVFAYLSVVLTAMQVGLATQELEDSFLFQEASVVFTVFSIIAPLVALAFVGLVFFVLGVNNLVDHLRADRFAKLERQKRKRDYGS